ncbi:bifunctional precorrin-2 dehydrogenase/sirohydrochlorin ferrochelatase [Sphingorhabdus sp. SMR4y]|uniref:precorrin-2 dehydrogenase/sirohydrochlorin ferrochelatase family protein n=1 Tax=Sphingorhabdus sp. SMR4y TaxID=2584094 RepID=UPI000B5C7D3A|nr:bifunctional precorrin-2 dehydrogenase/sirohydrochlorin ferrochelatase [Sphingorhabdus sp. SMR4y]ASK89501.1 siroheme synthase [Sphingorhabdus sp. SMR4y]
MNQLPIFVNLQGRKILLLGRGEMADAKKRLYERAGAIITDDETADGLTLAVVALEDDDEAIAAATRLKARGLLVNAVDRSALCDYTTPAIIDRDPVLIAIGTGGASAGLAKALRQRLEQILPVSLGTLATGLLAARERIRKIWPEAAARRKAIDSVLDPGAPLDVLADHGLEDLEAWLDQPQGETGSQVIDWELTSTDPDDLTLRQARWLGQADQIFASEDVPDAVLDRARADAERFALTLWDERPIEGLTLRIRMTK